MPFNDIKYNLQYIDIYFVDNSYEFLILYAGSDDRNLGERRPKTKLTQYHIHPNFYGEDDDNWDFGIIELEYPFGMRTDSENRYLINTVCLPSDEPELHNGTEDATVFGWGYVECCEKVAKILQKAVFNVGLNAGICNHYEYYCSLWEDCTHFPHTIQACQVSLIL